ncbi:MAG: cytochrome c-type biogenesis protein CcmH [Anaerolineales bacterium]|nr:cytochrome c-type biogenesis protein CcmH [Anaerolineales bacterium]
MKKFFYTVLFLFLLSILFTGAAFAQDNQPTDDEVNAVAHQLYCPVCQNTPLDVCPTEACRDWREQIRGMLAEGKTEDEILQYFVDQFGDRVLSAPPVTTKFNYIIYIVPPLIILAGAIILFRSLKEWTTPKDVAADLDEEESASSSQEDDYVARFEEELKKQK